ncbi:helix-turn-helix domain-containing protein [Enterococcus sp. DIV0876]|uniref:helix-turn-helix domain-containing protein n=1 Tax=Enterococcus sp. DIV0876 TaxID=2774633 RepID=UPI003D2FCBFE
MKNLVTSLMLDGPNKRCFSLLTILERMQNIETQELADLVGTSKRTINSDINDIRHFFGPVIDLYGTNKGMRLVINDYTAFYHTKRKYLEHDPLMTILQAIFYGSKLFLNEWAERLSFSGSTVSRMINSTQAILAEYDLAISKSPVCIQGDELSIRKFYFDFFNETSFLEINAFVNACQPKLVDIILEEVEFISIKKVQCIVNLVLHRIDTICLPLNKKGIATIKEQPVIYKLFDTLRMSSCFTQISTETLYSEVYFMYFMLYAHWDNRRQTGITLTGNSETAEDFGEALKIVISQELPELDTRQLDHWIQDFLARQYAKVCINKVFLKNTIGTNSFAKSIHPSLHKKVHQYLVSETIPIHFDNAYKEDICASLLLYLFVNRVIHSPLKVVVILSSDSAIDESAHIVFENFFKERVKIYYEEELTYAQYTEISCDVIVTNIIPFHYPTDQFPHYVYLSKYASMQEIIRLAATILSNNFHKEKFEEKIL